MITCVGPISVPEQPYDVATWRQEDADWERWQISGRDALVDGNDGLAGEGFARSLRIARQGFVAGDPRLASSLASHGFMLSKRDDPLARQLLTEALEHWDQVQSWIDLQPLPRRARSSMFHLRLEAKHPGAYRRNLYRRCLALVEEGRVATSQLLASLPLEGGHGSSVGVDRCWRPDRHDGFDLLRKLTAAVRLMAYR